MANGNFNQSLTSHTGIVSQGHGSMLVKNNSETYNQQEA